MATALTECRACGATSLETFLSLGAIPKVNSFGATREQAVAEPRYPLALAHCAKCTHVQLTHMLDPEELFTEYLYFSAFSESVVRWGQTLADRYARELSLGKQDLVGELASNDGCVLKSFGARSRILGVEPARNVAEAALKAGVPTKVEFFSGSVGARLRQEDGAAKLILARNVVAHVPALVDFLKGAASWLSEDGIFHIEVPYLGDMIHGLEFDTAYHEHLSYFSLTAIGRALERAGLVLWDVERIPLHGGSLAVRARKRGEPTKAVRALLEEEAQGSVGLPRLRQFAADVERLRRELPDFLRELKAKGARLMAYGAAAKGVVLTNTCGIDAELLPSVADRSTYKVGRFMPGTGAKIVPVSEVLEGSATHLVVLAWNFFDEIARQLDGYAKRGGKFVLPVPRPRIASAEAKR